jgi:hypothetical protein
LLNFQLEVDRIPTDFKVMLLRRIWDTTESLPLSKTVSIEPWSKTI